ncbi:hypothetical protein GCM10011363_22410 [Marivita lacus]|uniref:Glycerol-3-phosphate dehydrogenase n=1 Tax=Marivita lacus TaxID=1323742 RepID=A0ABQ1KN79_9RHOB|nr:hypothetical protein [Marivita lacus]GGC05210.1 hypothetical protein GCM10011363_22410 [Marivita lacus]
MSDPVTNVEIEDVLSSIRRLVAEEVRATPVARRRPEKPGRLVLTAAQRVKDAAPEPARASDPVLLTQPVVPGIPQGESAIDEIPGEARLAEFGRVEGAFPDIDSLHLAEDAAERSDDAHEQDVAEDEAQSEAGDDASRSELNRLIEKEVSAALGLSGADDADAQSDQSDWADELSDEDWQDIAEEQADASEFRADESEAEDHDESETAADLSDASDWVEPEAGHQEDTAPIQSPPQTLEDKVAALGRLVARGNEDFEEERDRPDADDLSAVSEPMTWPEAPYEDAEEEAEDPGTNVLHAQDSWPQPQSYSAPVQDEPATTGAVQVRDDDAASALEIDEETLRQMVVDIVRQELQGALGERITRNVRKLVRREIHRMLISQDFE